MSRVKRGIYITVPLEAKYPSDRREEPWIVAATVFKPGYMGGWTACEHWGLTDQIFSDIVVFTTRRVRSRKQVIQNTTFIIKVVSSKKMTGLKNVWINNVQVNVSDPSHTIADILANPHLGGGIRHVADVLEEYFGNKHRNDAALTEYVKLNGNRTAAKRLGYLLETMEIRAPEVIRFCQKYKSTGYSKLDPKITLKGRLLRRWNLEINARIEKKDTF
ncbi:MAG: type IV toxin-antitoxin system AbiEi family antitoxin [bacterium]|nr:type IV toxin-antitoxin system AbiEi family antitoxin [bacterium]